MKVLIFGASGFIGLPVAQALSRAGHTVYGLTRSTTKANQLAADEIFPIIGEPKDVNVWKHLIPTIDVVIEALGGTADLRNIAVTLHEAVASASASRPPGSPKVSYIYTSGIWVHGSSPDEFISDTTPLVNPVALVVWRPAVEQLVLKDERLNGIVIRPALLYGKGASLFESLFETAETSGKVAWYGKPGGRARFALVHPDDLADLYVRAAEKAPVLGGLAIDAGNDYTEPVDDFLQQLVLVSGAKGPHEWVAPSNVFEQALASTQLLRPYLAKSLLGWQPKKPGFTEGLPMYYAAWKASRDGQAKETLFGAQQGIHSAHM